MLERMDERMDGWPFPICGLVDARGIPYLYIRTAAATFLKVSIDVQRGRTDGRMDVDGQSKVPSARLGGCIKVDGQ